MICGMYHPTAEVQCAISKCTYVVRLRLMVSDFIDVYIEFLIVHVDEVITIDRTAYLN